GGDEEMAGGAGGEGAPRGPDAGIDHDEVHRALREAMPRARQDVLAGPEIAGRHLVGDVEYRRAVHAREQRAFDLADVAVRGAEIGEERDDRGHSVTPSPAAMRPRSRTEPSRRRGQSRSLRGPTRSRVTRSSPTTTRRAAGATASARCSRSAARTCSPPLRAPPRG